MLPKIRYRLVYNYASKLNQDGRANVAIEARQGLQKAYFKTNVLLYPHQWARGKVINHDNAAKLTVYLIRRMGEIEDVELSQLLIGHQMSLSQLRTAVRSGTRPSATLHEFVSTVIDHSDRCESTKKAYHTLCSEVSKFDKSVTISTITYDWIERWRNYQRGLGLSENTVKGRLKQMRCLVSEAMKRDLISADPFRNITIGNFSPKVEYLTMAELRRFENASLTGKEAVIRDFCLLSAYTGLRYSDLATLEEAEIKNGILRKKMYKTKRWVTIPIGTLFYGKGLEIINRYQPITRLSHVARHNSTVNKAIKEIAAKIGVRKSVHVHLFRKSCASLLYQLGMPMQDVSMVLGHSKTDITSLHYIFTKEKSMIKSSKKLFKGKEEEEA